MGKSYSTLSTTAQYRTRNIVMSIDFKSLTEIQGTEEFMSETAIIIEGPPIEILAQRGAPTVVLKPLRQMQGKYYYECKIITDGYMQLGWADEMFKAFADEGKGCGDDAHSWAFDGMRCLKWHLNNKVPYGKRWKAEDVVGFAVDLTSGEIRFSLNGDDLGPAFTGIVADGAIYPCLTLLRGQRIQINLGTTDNPFVFTPPAGYLPLTVTHPVTSLAQNDYNKFSSFVEVIQLGPQEQSLQDSFSGKIMVEMMKRGLDYEAKKNALVHAGYQETLKTWQERKDSILANLEKLNVQLTEDEIFAIICYTLETPQVYRYFNNETRRGHKTDSIEFPILSYLLEEACKKILAATPKEKRKNTVYRGVNLPFSAEVGKIIRFGNYTSTSLHIEVAQKFQDPTVQNTLFVIVTKVGASIKALSKFPEEEEILIPVCENFRVDRVEKSAPTVIYLTSCLEDSFVDKYVSEVGSDTHT